MSAAGAPPPPPPPPALTVHDMLAMGEPPVSATRTA